MFVRFMIICAMLSMSAGSAGAEEKLNCISCHAGNEIETGSHFIETNDDCMFCHEVSDSGSQHSVTTITSNASCVSCHVAQDNLNSTNTHNEMLCSDCHSPHGSEINLNLPTEIVSLCSGSCHTFGEIGLSHPVGEEVPDMHTGTEMTCVSSCHSIHTPTEPKLLKLSSTQLCYQCHNDKF